MRIAFPIVYGFLILATTWRVDASPDHERLGREALSHRLWEVAAGHFSTILGNPEADPESKARVRLLLAQCHLRAGENKQALDLLESGDLTDLPESAFWRGLALAGAGRYHEALDSLSPSVLDPTTRWHAEAVFTAANLHLALDNPNDALAALTPLASTTGAPECSEAALRRTAILLDLGDVRGARASFPALTDSPEGKADLARLLEGQLLLREGDPEKSLPYFRSLLAEHVGESNRITPLAAVGYVDSLIDLGRSSEAGSFMIEFITQAPDTPMLGALFDRIYQMVPENPTVGDPLWERIVDWSGVPSLPASGAIVTEDAGAVGALPLPSPPPPHYERIIHSLYGRTLVAWDSKLPQIQSQLHNAINRLLTEAPSHQLTARLRLRMARHTLDSGERSSALDQFSTLHEVAPEPMLRGMSAFDEAMTLYRSGDYAAAIPHFLDAANELEGEDARAARFNARLTEWILNPVENVAEDPNSPADDPAISADLSLERALATSDPASQRNLIEAFLTAQPDHPRAPEARLAAAEAALSSHPADLSFARAQVDTLRNLSGLANPPDKARLDLLGIRIADLDKKPEEAIAGARAFLEAYPDHPLSSEALFLLGRNLFRSGNYNDARLALERLAHMGGASERAQSSWLLAARAAAMVATQQSRQEALIIFDNAIAAPGPLAPLARLEKSRLLIDLNRSADAIQLLRPWLDKLPIDDPLKLPGGFLLAEAVRTIGTPQSLADALTILDQLLASAKDQPAAFHRLQYLRGLTLEQMDDPEKPAQKRKSEAFIAYYSVLESTEPPLEWYYFELCGFKALGLLMDAGRWPAAIACARKIASFQGPRAGEAAEIASQLQLKHTVWED